MSRDYIGALEEAVLLAETATAKAEAIQKHCAELNERNASLATEVKTWADAYHGAKTALRNREQEHAHTRSSIGARNAKLHDQVNRLQLTVLFDRVIYVLAIAFCVVRWIWF